jgi:hypothetical protein
MVSSRRTKSPAPVEVTGLIRKSSSCLPDAAIDDVGRTVNAVSFDMGWDGKTTLRDPLIEPITDADTGAKS